MARGAFYGPGRYWGRIVAQALGESSKGNPQIVFTFLVLGKINPDEPDGDLISCEQFERSIYRVITDKTIDFVTEDLQKLGFEGTSFRQIDPNAEGFHDFRGQELAFFCEHDTYEGSVREKWGLARDGGLVVKPLDDKAVRQLDALYGKHLKKAKPKVQPASHNDRELNEVLAAGTPDDEIPF